ncbi:MAG: hypothetical protein AABX01_05315 [Candidatus Micrarchaeota archaeon]
MKIDFKGRFLMLAGMFENRRYAMSFGMLFTILLGAYFLMSGTFLLSLMQFNESAEMPFVALQVLIALLAAIQLSIMLNFGGKKGDLAGGFVALFASACPVCVPLWIYALGLGGSLAFLSDFSLAMGLFAVALLAYSLWRCLDPQCKVIKYEKSVLR